MDNPIIVIMAGGTGGHIFPGLAVAEKLQATGYSVHWLGSVGGIEENIVAKYKIPLKLIKAKAIRNKSFITKIVATARIFQALIQIIKLFIKLKPAYVIGFGGYVTGAGGIAAKILNIPLAIHEQNSIAGFTNKILAKIATKVFSGFPTSFKSKRSKKIFLTGSPVRKSIHKILPWQPNIPCRILVLGGSQGAVFINKILLQTLSLITKNISIWHQTGGIDFTNCLQTYQNYPHIESHVEAFIHDIDKAYEWANLVICRSGALTIAELAVAGRPSILIPYPYATDNHQYENGKYLADNNAAILLQQHEIGATKLTAIIENLIVDNDRLKNMAANAKILSFPNASNEIVKHFSY